MEQTNIQCVCVKIETSEKTKEVVVSILNSSHFIKNIIRNLSFSYLIENVLFTNTIQACDHYPSTVKIMVNYASYKEMFSFASSKFPSGQFHWMIPNPSIFRKVEKNTITVHCSCHWA